MPDVMQGRAHAAASSHEEKRHGCVAVFAEYFPAYMGSDRRIYELTRQFRRWNAEYVVVPPLRILGGRCEPSLEEYFRTHFLEGVVEDESGGQHAHYLRLPRVLLRAWRRLSMPVAYALTIPYLVREAAAHLRARKPDVVILAHPSYLCGLVGLLAARLVGLPVLLDFPDAWTPLAVETAGIDAKSKTAHILHFLEGAVARGADRIVNITAVLDRYVRALGVSAPADIVANGADERHFDRDAHEPDREMFGWSAQDEIVMYSGRLEPWSGVDEIVETVRRVVGERPRARFVFIGDGSSAGRLREEIIAAGLLGRVDFLGFRPYADMPKLIACADLAIIPFPRTPTTEPCSPVKLFEYALMGATIITTDLAGVRESVDDEHVVFLAELSPELLSSSILSLLRDPQRRARLAENVYRHTLERYTWKRLAAAFEDSIDRLHIASRVAR